MSEETFRYQAQVEGELGRALTAEELNRIARVGDHRNLAT